jgi:glycosyltransferase involved in cell wall biosynthesis
LNPNKRIQELLSAAARLRTSKRGVFLVFAGELAAGVELHARATKLGLASGKDYVHFDRVDETRLWALINACDVCVNLRHPTMGETSGMAIRALSASRPLVVSDVGWFAELPSGVAAKVPVDGHEVETLAAMLERLAQDPGLRSAMSAAAASYAQSEHRLERVAELYASALEEAAGGAQVQDRVLAEAAGVAHEVGLRAGDAELAAIGAGLRDVGLSG